MSYRMRQVVFALVCLAGVSLSAVDTYLLYRILEAVS